MAYILILCTGMEQACNREAEAGSLFKCKFKLLSNSKDANLACWTASIQHIAIFNKKKGFLI